MKFGTMMMALILGSAAPVANAGALPQPGYTPAQAVRLQLEALRENDRPAPDAGIATVFGFASPSNRQQTGPLPRFVKMIRGNYADLLGHRQARLFSTQYEDDQAIQPVEVISSAGVSFRYLFILRRYQLPQGRCWLTDGVVGKPVDARRSAAWKPARSELE